MKKILPERIIIWQDYTFTGEKRVEFYR